MLPSDIIGSEYGKKWRGGSGLFHAGSAASLLALDEAHDSHDIEAKFAGCCNGLDGRRPGRAYIVDNYYARWLFAESLDALSGSMLLFRFADEESMDVAADDGDRDHNRIGAHG
jgi:hypothetical protein